ncbi:two-component sensor histidine kinase [Brevirhabdus pacifica]|uniref:histidine kinase n=1 Tax=Brevirhabdus pacifica TaxID=1267768 RepID=A0A1U7DEL5_9RHOB|nr:ATP-binding protein [Brevirhabdus pacifica]APX88437.1 two-component sensor histidine kinase [Brevirhabdus pacifica]OWU79745.1 histidine kinase [Loktanella sp. 22II-4b]PJJ87099.1 two-component system osmolarity sensor histidine kinase EnvZ [Brevirhabdus pacifica]
MFFAWLKRYMPRSLYGRAALILIVPILVIQLVVGVAFLQRHFEGVTRQMTRNVALEVNFLADEVNASDPGRHEERARALGEPLALRTEFVRTAERAPSGTSDQRLFYDISGRVVIRTLRAEVPALRTVDLASDLRSVRMVLATRHGPMELSFRRGRVSASNPHQLLVLTLLTGVLMTFVAYRFLRNQLRPIKRLARAAEGFGKGHTVPFSPSGATEVRAAGNAFLDMRARIERQIEQRTMMLSGVSHDLRTPLTRLKLGLAMMDDPEAEALIRDVDEMEALLDAFLDFARGDATEEMTPTDPAALAREVVEAACRGGQQVTLAVEDAGGEGPQPAMRPLAVSRALTNLVSNAVRYGSRARVTLTVLGKSVRFTVEDDGPGIPDDRREEAMKPFARLDASRNQNRGSGVGLGLAIAADVARNHGGALRLGQSEELGGLKAELVIARHRTSRRS